jgi:hypothetical protein
MILASCFDNFVAQSPISVMMRAIIEQACGSLRLNAIFEQKAQQQYTRTLEFSTVAMLMSEVVFDSSASIGAAFQNHHDQIPVTRKALYNKLNAVEPAISAAVVTETVSALEQIIDHMGSARPALLAGYRVKILDGNHLAATERRLKPLRSNAGAPLPGHALVVFEPHTGLVTGVIPCQDGHASERSLLEPLLRLVAPRDLWIADRNFCTTALLHDLSARGAAFVIRQHGTMPGTLEGERIDRGRCASGHVYEQTLLSTDTRTKATLRLRRITIVLDTPTRSRQSELHLVSNVPAEDATAAQLADLYGKRWRIETLFQELTETLCCEIKTLGYPQAALLGFCLALLASNVLAVIKAALRAAHPTADVDQTVSGYYLAQEIGRNYGGMMIAIAAPEWRVFAPLSTAEMALLLTDLAVNARLSKYQKHPRGPKKPKPKRTGSHSSHVSTAKLLAQRKSK